MRGKNQTHRFQLMSRYVVSYPAGRRSWRRFVMYVGNREKLVRGWTWGKKFRIWAKFPLTGTNNSSLNLSWKFSRAGRTRSQNFLRPGHLSLKILNSTFQKLISIIVKHSSTYVRPDVNPAYLLHTRENIPFLRPEGKGLLTNEMVCWHITVCWP